MAQALARGGRYQEAIAYFSTVGSDQDNYLEVQHYIADLLNDAGQTEKAMELLNELFMKHNDVEALIRIGDMYRGKEKYGNALKAYNRAAGQIGDKIPEEYWYLLYARGMVYEREGDWDRAERDLKAAMVYRPDHPYLLNYLGYAWADQGVNLEESLKLIERAAALRPDDGFIKDSLGWVLYMMGRYNDAVPALEKAVELMPYDPVLNDHLGDAYWQVGRHLEARFQWQRAFNYAEEGDEKLKKNVTAKLEDGLPPQKPVKEAHSSAAEQKSASP
jgi:tetratricopeptide (TPR) repeat protein